MNSVPDRIAGAKARTERQRQLVTRLRENGFDAANAESLLRTMEGALVELERGLGGGVTLASKDESHDP
jgi:hypothetical protein